MKLPKLQTNKAFKAATTGIALIVLPLFANQALAETQVQIQTKHLNSDVSEGYSLSLEDWSAQTKDAREQKQPTLRRSSRHASQFTPQVWVASIGSLLFDDLDGDGYHSGFSLTIDVDSEFGDTDVYATIYLSGWNEELNLLHTSEIFTIYGSLIGDEYRIDTELRQNFPTDNYDITIDIHDAWSDVVLDTVNARVFTNLSALPLESSDNEYVYVDYSDDQNDDDDSSNQHPASSSADIVIREYAGALHPALFLVILAGLLLRRRA